MTTTDVTRPQSPTIEDPHSSWTAMLDQWARHQWRRFHGGRDPQQWPPSWALPAAVTAGLIAAVAIIAGIIVPIVRGIVSVSADAAGAGAGWLHDWVAARIVLEPVRGYLDAHATGLPITAGTLWWTWCATGIGLFAFAMLFRAVAARLGWVLYGTATATMVWVQSSGPSRPVTTAIAVLWWIVLSLLALRRRWGTPRVQAYLPDLAVLAGLLQRRDG